MKPYNLAWLFEMRFGQGHVERRENLLGVVLVRDDVCNTFAIEI